MHEEMPFISTLSVFVIEISPPAILLLIETLRSSVPVANVASAPTLISALVLLRYCN